MRSGPGSASQAISAQYSPHWSARIGRMVAGLMTTIVPRRGVAVTQVSGGALEGPASWCVSSVEASAPFRRLQRITPVRLPICRDAASSEGMENHPSKGERDHHRRRRRVAFTRQGHEGARHVEVRGLLAAVLIGGCQTCLQALDQGPRLGPQRKAGSQHVHVHHSCSNEPVDGQRP